LHWLRFHHDSHDAIHLFLLFPQTLAHPIPNNN
jgi:hypothetical protein